MVAFCCLLNYKDPLVAYRSDRFGNSKEMVDERYDDFSDRKFKTEIYYTCFRISKRFHKITKNNMRTLWSAELERTEMPFIRRCTVCTIHRSLKHLQQTENLFSFI